MFRLIDVYLDKVLNTKIENTTDAFTINLSRKIFEDFNLEASYKYRSQPLDFNSYLLESDYKEYNWENKNLLNQHFRTRSWFKNLSLGKGTSYSLTKRSLVERDGKLVSINIWSKKHLDIKQASY